MPNNYQSQDRTGFTVDFSLPISNSTYSAGKDPYLAVSGFSGSAAVSNTVDGQKAGQSGFSGAGVLPNVYVANPAGFSAFWTPSKNCEFKFEAKTPASVANTIYAAGWKLTNTDAVATDDDQAFFRAEQTENSGEFYLHVSKAGTDYSYPTGVLLAADTKYTFEVDFLEDGTVLATINGKQVQGTNITVTTTAMFKPFFSAKNVAAGSATAKGEWTLQYLNCNRKK